VSKYTIPADSGLAKPEKPGVFLFSRDEDLRHLQLRLDLGVTSSADATNASSSLAGVGDDAHHSSSSTGVEGAVSKRRGDAGAGDLMMARAMSSGQQYGWEWISVVSDEASARQLAQRPPWFAKVWKQVHHHQHNQHAVTGDHAQAAGTSIQEDGGYIAFGDQLQAPADQTFVSTTYSGYDGDGGNQHARSGAKLPAITYEEQCRLRRKMRHNLKRLVQDSNKESYYKYVNL
jgi:hypothetical protein